MNLNQLHAEQAALVIQEKINMSAQVSLTPTIFRAYDIRGIVDQTLTEEDVFLIGKALGSIAHDQGIKQIAVARDGRISGPKLIQALSKGILSTGCDVLDIGMVPTPVLYYAAHSLPDHSGVMLTGSHNPAEYNGLKMVLKGITIAEAGITELYDRIISNRLLNGQGDHQSIDLTAGYIEAVCQSVHLARPLKIVVDAGNGVTGSIAPALFRALGCEVQTLFCDIDGHFPNHHPDPGEPQNLQDLIHAVKAQYADLGFAFDGDGDRLGVVTNEGDIIYPDRLLMLYAQALLSEQPGATIIYDVKCTYHLADLIRSLGGEPLIWRTGHSLIKKKLAETNAALAGEMSGHFFFKDRWNGFDDALYAGARLLEILAQRSQTCAEVFAGVPNSINTPELKVMVNEDEKFALMQALINKAAFNDAKDIMTIDGLRVNFADGWGLVRPSNTSPYLILRFEAINEPRLAHIQNLFKTWMLSVKPDLVLPF